MALFEKKNNMSSIIEVQLLPEKEKRDYILRLVSYTLVMLFVIANFFIIYLPRLDLIDELHKVKGDVYHLEQTLDNSNDQLENYDQTLYNINKNNEINKIETINLDYETIINDIEELSPNHSFIESINYSDGEYTLGMTIQFDTYLDLTQFHNNVNLIDYIDMVSTGSINIIEMENPSYVDRVKTSFSITFNLEKAPKAGGIYE